MTAADSRTSRRRSRAYWPICSVVQPGEAGKAVIRSPSGLYVFVVELHPGGFD
ncbi:hypothetical protein [Streptomyces lunaelactis]|uniref:hypothetical protein n=1 Tax=Streptomyces lunaelactis TaxID=1535768 RepID=UPI001585D01F|nr:hypothetical protein [Streptomyces lunaelactis]NUK72728.1 hypothetical protein [Streptomyces lunaelactis]